MPLGAVRFFDGECARQEFAGGTIQAGRKFGEIGKRMEGVLRGDVEIFAGSGLLHGG